MDATTCTSTPASQLPLRTLVYRYFFFSWLFRDVGSGDAFQRGLAVQHNRRQARWLPTYMLRWAWWGLLFYAVGGFVEMTSESVWWARWFYAASAMCLSFIVTMGTAWVHLTQRGESA